MARYSLTLKVEITCPEDLNPDLTITRDDIRTCLLEVGSGGGYMVTSKRNPYKRSATMRVKSLNFHDQEDLLLKVDEKKGQGLQDIAYGSASSDTFDQAGRLTLEELTHLHETEAALFDLASQGLIYAVKEPGRGIVWRRTE